MQREARGGDRRRSCRRSTDRPATELKKATKLQKEKHEKGDSFYKFDGLAVYQLERSEILPQMEEDALNGRLGFRVGDQRGFGLKRKSIKWLHEWQRLQYTSPYVDSCHLDPQLMFMN
ncbi:hypothetical protein E3N88_08026 [Mikania micrantha]|uniref:PORR domain-containing protein n=1 Tax=Mikania micrantha TaxID=192012 RepID=A0A5N6PH19_9ASTR|nr:hypothetical protein E3N88_08026 [Mikania micrantha]